MQQLKFIAWQGIPPNCKPAAGSGQPHEELYIMRELFTTQELNIPAGQAVSGIARKGQSLRVVSGRVWVTVESVSHDYWLYPGDKLTLAPGLLTVIEADQSCSKVELAREHGGSALPGFISQLQHFARHLAGGKNINPALPQAALAPCKQQMKNCA
jgi:hypothetical protein